MLNRKLYLEAIKFFEFSLNLDCFASRINCQLWSYVSFKPDPYAKFVDAFSINWSKYNCYIFPPFNIIGHALQKIRVDKATALRVLPRWPTQPWWPLMMKMSVQQHLIIDPSPTNLFLPNHPEEKHPLHQKLTLIICLLSGRVTKIKD